MCGSCTCVRDMAMTTDVFRLLVGAPRARALAQQRANITGGLYSCDITSRSHGCERIDFDNEGQYRRLKCPPCPHTIIVCRVMC